MVNIRPTAKGIFWVVLLAAGGMMLVWLLYRNRESAMQTPAPIYTHTNPDFSFSYPDGYGVASVAEGKGESLIVRRPNDPGRGFQIVISPFDEPDLVLTPERLRADIPDIVIKNPQQVALSSDIQALSFVSADSSLGETQEVWFVRGGYLYQVSAPLTEKQLALSAAASLVWPK